MRRSSMLAGLCLALAAATASLGQAGRELSAPDKALAIQIEGNAQEQLRAIGKGTDNPAFSGRAITALSATPAGKIGKSLVTQVNAVRTPDPADPPRALVARYDYATGLTFRTVVDLAARRVESMKADSNFPTPLAEDEIRRAGELAAEAIGASREGQDRMSGVRTLAIIDTQPASSTYGHRLVVIWREAPARSPRVLVDLTQDEIAKPKY